MIWVGESFRYEVKLLLKDGVYQFFHKHLCFFRPQDHRMSVKALRWLVYLVNAKVIFLTATNGKMKYCLIFHSKFSRSIWCCPTEGSWHISDSTKLDFHVFCRICHALQWTCTLLFVCCYGCSLCDKVKRSNRTLETIIQIVWLYVYNQNIVLM